MVMKKLVSTKLIKYVVIILVIAGLGGGAYFIYRNMSSKATAASNSGVRTVQVARGDIDVTISGTGTVQPISRYDIVPLVKGSIISAPFEEGMSVKSGDLLYKIDDSDLSYNLQKAQNSIEKLKINNQQSEDSKNNLVVYAPIGGRVSNLTIKEGEQAGSSGKIADITDDKHVIATIPFKESQVNSIKIGQQAQIAVPDYMVYIDGTVKHVSSTAKSTAGGAMGYDVEISINNPGAVTEGMKVAGTIKTPDGDISSPFEGKMGYAKSQPVIAKTTGKIKMIYVKNDEWIEAGQKVLELENDTINDTIYKNSLDLKDSQLSMDAQKKQLNDYNILSPINGTVIKKYYKAGDTVGNSTDSKILMTVADITNMVFTIEVDELDVAKVVMGQKVGITADALSGTSFTGEVTSVPMEGKTQNGVTTYPVQVTVLTPGKLKPGMNVNAKINVESKKDVLYLPMAAVTKMGDKAFVFVKGNSSSGKAVGKNGDASQANPANPANRGNADGGQSTQNSTGGSQQGSQRTGGQGGNRPDKSVAGTDGRQRRSVVVGINNDSYIEIVSGLTEKETVYMPSISTNNNSSNTTGARGGIMGGGGAGLTGGGNMSRMGQGH